MVNYNNKRYYIDVEEAKPANAISIIETDCEVDFAPPLDYTEPAPVFAPPQPAAPAAPVLGRPTSKSAHSDVSLVSACINALAIEKLLAFGRSLVERFAEHSCYGGRGNK